MADQWNLNDLYEGFDTPAFQDAFKALTGMVEKMNAFAENLNTFPDAAALIEEKERYTATIERVGSFASLLFSTNTANPDANKYLYKAEELDAETSRIDVRLAAFLAEHGKNADLSKLAEEHGMGDYAYLINRMVERHAHMMSEDEEALATKMIATGSSAWNTLHTKLVSTLTCQYDGKTININACRNLAHDPDVNVRKAAYEAELAAYPQIAEASAASLNGIKGEVNLLTKKRNYARPLDHTLFSSAMTQKTLDAMFAAMDDGMQYFRDYLKMKAAYLSKTLNAPYNSLPFYDLFAPLGTAADKKITYDDAKELVLTNFRRFSPKMAEVAKLAFDNSWIDVYPREGKRSGAFCADIYAIKQFRILLNFGGSISDAVTLAHELGHGYHSMNTMQERILNSNYPMPLAETASTFCENVVNNAILATLSDNEKLQILDNSLQGATQVVVDIYSRFLFEKAVFETRADHPLSVEEFNNLMLDAQKTAYGDGLDQAFLHPYMWVIKPHYYGGGRSFYNFPYAFGHLLANGLYALYESNPAAFGEKYDNFLRISGRMPIKEACATIGIDVEDKNFWADAIVVEKEKIKMFKQLTA
jgi:pepF/M3 family oligoendopeptidase